MCNVRAAWASSIRHRILAGPFLLPQSHLPGNYSPENKVDIPEALLSERYAVSETLAFLSNQNRFPLRAVRQDPAGQEWGGGQALCLIPLLPCAASETPAALRLARLLSLNVSGGLRARTRLASQTGTHNIRRLISAAAGSPAALSPSRVCRIALNSPLNRLADSWSTEKR